MSHCSEVSSWSNCTGTAVWLIGIVPSSAISAAPGVPGSMSTKKLPSRKMRGRIFARASSWIGRPALPMVIVTMRGVAARREAGSTFVTLPTSTPAMRTGEPFLRLLEDSKAALISYCGLNGIDLVNPR